MSFYKKLSQYYDEIFPLGQAQSVFLEKSFEKNSKILDLAAGTGTYTFYLNEKGYEVDAIELDHDMCNQFKAKLKDPFELTVFEMDMRLIDEFCVKYDGIYCIGNSIVHLGSLEEIESMIQKTYDELNDNGTLVIQIVNYDRILDGHITELPTIKRPKSNLEFERIYKLEDNKVQFVGKLHVQDEIFESVVPLITLRKDVLKSMLEKSGFKTIEIYGSFNEDTWTDESFATVIRAVK